MTEGVDFTVLEPGQVDAATSPAPAPATGFTVLMEVAPGQVEPVPVDATEAGIGRMVDVLHRVGGEPLVRSLYFAVSASMRGAPYDEVVRRAAALRLIEAEMTALRTEITLRVAELDRAARQAFEHDLTVATAELRPERFGILAEPDATPRAARDDAGRATYRALRTALAQTDRLRRRVRSWSFTIPPNAPTARHQFEHDVLGPYLGALTALGTTHPGMIALAPRLIEALADESRADVAAWAQASTEDGDLDATIIGLIVDAGQAMATAQPGYRATMLAQADRVLDAALTSRPFHEPGPADLLGGHPLWRHPFLIHAAMEQAGLLPGDHGYAVASEGLAAAAAQRWRDESDAAQTDQLLGWASLGFGALSVVPVVGLLARAAGAVTLAVQLGLEAARQARTREASAALGHRATAYAVGHPDATGLVVLSLGMVSDAALPVLGRLLRATVLLPATRVLTAQRVATTLQRGQDAADLAGLLVDANAAATERELRRLGLLPDGQH